MQPGGGTVRCCGQHSDRLGKPLPRDRQLCPRPYGGHRPKKLVGEYREWLLQRCREKAFTLRGLVDELAERGLSVDYRVVWQFVHDEKLSYKKRRWSPASGIART